MLNRLLCGDQAAIAKARETLFAAGGNGSSLAAIYRAAGTGKGQQTSA